MAEGDAAGVQLVLVAAELEPFPDMPLSPVLGVDRRPVGVARCTRGERSEGRCPLGEPLEGLLKAALVMLTTSSLVQAAERGSSPGVFCWGPGPLLFCSKDQKGLDPTGGL